LILPEAGASNGAPFATGLPSKPGFSHDRALSSSVNANAEAPAPNATKSLRFISFTLS